MNAIELPKFIIESMLDIDFYKFTMGQLIFHRYPDVHVKYALKVRTKDVHLAACVKEDYLRYELDHVRTLKFRSSELHYLRGTNEYSERMFKEDYLEFLKNLKLPPYELKRVGDDYELTFEGLWSEAIYWETLVLSIINELYYRALMAEKTSFEQDIVYATGKLRLAEKIKKLRANPKITFSDFGTRRRFSRDWQKYVVHTLAAEIPNQLLGTSNVLLANNCNLLSMGTNAHETDMGVSGVMHGDDDEIRASHNKVLEDWWDEYGFGLSIALTDTYGSDFFFSDMTKEQAEKWKGLRQDSGDPIEFGEKALRFYKKHGIDPKTKFIVFSDGLDIDTMVKITNHFRNKIKIASFRTTYGWGTNLTNDLGFSPLSMVIKLVESNGHGTVKLSDNLAKAMGKPEDIERFKKIFGHTVTLNESCTY
ncbi:nicotinate phosphoribosyltransferase [Candidatus Giovannonibacteria bacterium RIFCSPHIGHO2_02_43_13]|uniref:Nicotinate phosphoribosyltransferase n=1 Tax=Candidatus Giovannonibacteria bacterium RIFCSPHIGHO2_02_43_13 TaxID=1798330 RepID=A0A1F5WR94_9BACT|nr:MAG: Nicotinate phosphoribosyltransferase [Parcubacteria group bacterium GW2011_GWA2_44_13]OGF74640.1 MAG: nicotinate phosphoribosyltransferase [Candidatus Giovannonibacteria bacterium RIFCSPHIGHO2_12_FULL_44_42]OGF78195.1 MAG: nicotinate phosphoribosyltransferase [Candidatus Giovannonibacteria bacterium RIFCSPHIGHO2_02_43_13]OGF90061.1 MAG: nicotinate phosphoribosyltransferase [Candidatus Giovannonibacteria bacterium RIFCSPLOWO2_02_FULL_43_54]OGF96603.1 MAG: nicotinate phosphoribosyltransfe